MPFLLQWRGSSVNVRQSARATHPGMHMPSGHRAHRGLHMSRGECCESDAAGTAAASSSADMPQRRARLRGHVIHHHQHHHTQRKRACPQTTKSKAVPQCPQKAEQDFGSYSITNGGLHSILLDQKICNSANNGRWWVHGDLGLEWT